MNAKKELIEDLKGLTILCALVSFGEEWLGNEEKFYLKLNYAPEEYENFLTFMDRIYDSGYGGQELFGTIWFTDGTWLERREYDGSEWWEHKVYPNIPVELK